MANEHARSVRAAEKTNRDLRHLFGKLGTAEHPRGGILSAYRVARRALKSNLDNPLAVDEALTELRRSVTMTVNETLMSATDIGAAQATREKRALGLHTFVPFNTSQEQAAAANAVLMEVDRQISVTEAAVLTGSANIVLGDGVTRLGILQPAPVTREAAKWLTALMAAGWAASLRGSADRNGRPVTEFSHQAVAALDERTTDTCLRVHGQVKPLDVPFHLVGEPRFADDILHPPFHWYCRTAEALVRPGDADDELSQSLRNAARAEIRAREAVQAEINDAREQLARAGAAPDARRRNEDTDEVTRLRNELRAKQREKRVEIHPASGTSRR